MQPRSCTAGAPRHLANCLRHPWVPPAGALSSEPLGSASSAGTIFARPPGSLQVTSCSSAFVCRRDSQYTCFNRGKLCAYILLLCLQK